MSDSEFESNLVRRAAAGDEQALQTLFSQHSERLKRMLRLRLNRRLQGRIDSSDILQEAYLEIAKKLDEYLQNPEMSFFLWLRQMTGMKLAELHRQHLDTQKRDANRDVSIYRGALPAANSVSLAAQLLGQLTTPSEAAIKAEQRLRLQEVLDSMDPVDREIIALRHFEHLNSEEAAQVLGMSKSGASSRYVRALKRLKQTLSEFPEFGDS
ncbi:MAG: sigma-70 family RNA polymerase sigma factor [Gemmataceae bacterium]